LTGRGFFGLGFSDGFRCFRSFNLASDLFIFYFIKPRQTVKHVLAKIFFRSKYAKTRMKRAKTRQNSAETRQIYSQLQKPKAALSKLSLIPANSKPLSKWRSIKIEQKASNQNFNF
jgi:hypothetical protein